MLSENDIGAEQDGSDLRSNLTVAKFLRIFG